MDATQSLSLDPGNPMQ